MDFGFKGLGLSGLGFRILDTALRVVQPQTPTERLLDTAALAQCLHPRIVVVERIFLPHCSPLNNDRLASKTI